MMARFGVFVLLALVFIVLCGCSSCTEEVRETVSPDGRITVRVTLWGGCGGATVGYDTYVDLVRNRFWFVKRPHWIAAIEDHPNVKGFLTRPHGIAAIGRAPTVKPTWESEKLLTIRVTPDRGSYYFAWRKTEALGITIRWIVTEKADDYEPEEERKWKNGSDEILLP